MVESSSVVLRSRKKKICTECDDNKKSVQVPHTRQESLGGKENMQYIFSQTVSGVQLVWKRKKYYLGSTYFLGGTGGSQKLSMRGGYFISENMLVL